LLISASISVSSQDIRELSTVSGILSWMFNLQSIDFKAIGIFILLVALALLAFTAYATLFWVRMLSDALNRKFENESDKIAWVIVITFTHGLGAMLYYKLVKTKTDPGIIPKTGLKSPPPKLDKKF
jgi:hypothetical protein